MPSTITAISTPFGEGAVALLRVSGDAALDVAARVFRARRPLGELPARVQHLGEVFDETGVVDQALLTFFRAPASYTGENLVEIACHGGLLVTRRILELLLRNGAQMAEPGEFTQRAFLNGKLDLTQAEAVMDLIRARSDLALRAAAGQLEGRLGQRVGELREALLEILAHLEAHIDFPEEDIAPETAHALLARLETVQRAIAALLSTADQGRILREGLRTVIYGAPNVGKSSLLNRLLGMERAIVSDIPGTTRDTLEEGLHLRGIPLLLIDTAGVRESADVLERQGIARTLRQLEEADLMLQVVDASLPKPADFEEENAESKAAKLLILNKIDLGEHPDWADCDGVRVSCLPDADDAAFQRGMEALGEAVWAKSMGSAGSQGDVTVAINARHQVALLEAQKSAEMARQSLADGLSPELVAVDLRGALDAVGEIVGKVDTEELLGRIFARFCLGK